MTDGSAGDDSGQNGQAFWILRDASAAVIRLSVSGALDIATVPALQTQLQADRLTAAISVTLDLTGLSFIDSYGLRTIIRAAEELAPRLTIIPGGHLLRLLRLTGLEARLPLDPRAPPAT